MTALLLKVVCMIEEGEPREQFLANGIFWVTPDADKRQRKAAG